MKVDLSAAKPCTSELPPMCAATINQFKNAGSDAEFIDQLNNMKEWQSVIGKTEMIRWIEVLDRCDSILESACKMESFRHAVDTNPVLVNSVVAILRFTALLFENTSTRSIYASTDRLLTLLDCSNMEIVNEVLRLFLIISKRSHFLRNKLPADQQKTFLSKLSAIAQCWFKRLKSVKMCDVVKEELQFPTLFPFTFEDTNGKEFTIEKPHPAEPLFAVLEKVSDGNYIELGDSLLARLRAFRDFDDRTHRMQTLAARLISISTLMYARIPNDELQLNTILYDGFVDECAGLLKLDINLHSLIDTLKAEGLRTLTSLVAQDKQPKLQQVIDSLGASSYHGFLAVLTRQCVEDLRAGQLGQSGKASVALCTALFSLLYHMSGLDAGGEAIVACGLMQTLLSVVSCHSLSIDHITFVTRCVRVIDIVTTIDVQGFHQAKGMEACVERLVFEVAECKKEQDFVIDVELDKEDDSGVNEYVRCPPTTVPCHQQRSALVKSLLNFIKRVIQDNQFADAIRHIMEGDLPDALVHIISNADYYTASLFHNAIQLVTNFIYQEPSQLTLLQQRHVPFVILHSLLRKEIPASREVINNIANTFTALCLNERGLTQLKAYDPFKYVFKIVLSLKFISAMKRKRSELTDVAVAIGSAFDDLLRHQPSLRPLMIQSVLDMLKKLLDMGNTKEAKVVMTLSRSATKNLPVNAVPAWVQQRGIEGTSDSREPSVASGVQSPREEESEDDDDDDGDSNQAVETEEACKGLADLGLETCAQTSDGSRILPLGEYLLIFCKILEIMITQNASSEMVDGLVEGGVVESLLALFQVAPIRMELAHSSLPSCVATILKFLLQHSSNQRLLNTVMGSLCESMAPLAQLNAPITGSIGVLSQMGAQSLADALTSVTNATTVLSSLTKSAQTSQEELRNRVLSAWNEEDGQQVIDRLHTVFRVICGEMALYSVVLHSSKVSCTTQTDPADMTASTPSPEVTHETTPPQDISGPVDRTHVDCQPVDAVQTESAPPLKSAWEVAGISADEKEFWQSHKDIAILMSKAQKNLTDLLILLGRVCLRPQGRSRRGYEAVGPIGEYARSLAENLFKKYRDAMLTTSPPSMITNIYLTDLLEQLCSTVFDDRRHPHIPLLAVFYRSGTHKAFSQMLVDIIAPQFRRGQNELSLEGLMKQWIRLADRLANKNSIVNSRNKTSDISEFPPEKYHKLVQIDLYTSLNQLFAALSSEEVDLKANMKSCEMAIAIYKEVVRNLVALRDDAVPSRRGSDMPNPADLVDPNHLQMLVDMGFDSDNVVQALMECSTVAEATEYLIANQDAETRRGSVHDAFRDSGSRVRPRAEIATEENRLPAGGSVEDDTIAVQSIPSSSVSNTAPTSPCAEDIQALNKLHIDFNIEHAIARTCNDMIPLCKKLMDAGSDMVYSTADLVIGVVDSCDQQWKEEELIKNGMCTEIRELSESVMGSPQCKDTSRSLATRLHFACLLWEHIAEDYIKVLNDVSVRQTLIRLLHEIVHNPIYELHCQEKGILSPLLLWLDLYEKCRRLVRRKCLLQNAVGDADMGWSYYGWEERFGARGKWTSYPPNVSAVLSKAFLAGRPHITFKMNKKDYILNFTDMTQKSESGNGIDKNIVTVELPEKSEIDMEKIVSEESRDVWSKEEASELMSSLTTLLHKGKIHYTVAHSMLLLIARLTSEPSTAEEFVKENGINAVLHIHCASSPSTSALLSIIVRQCVDDEPMLSQMFERAIRSVAAGSHNNHMSATTLSSRWNPTRNAAMRDWKSSLYVLTPLIGRNYSLYTKTMGRIVKMNNGDIGVQPGTSSGHASATSHPNPPTQQIVEMLLREAVFGDWSSSDNSLAATNGRMVTRGAILNIVSELVRSYGCVASVVTDLKEDGHSLLYRLIDTYLEDTSDKDRHGAITCLIGTLAGCNHAPKAQEALVNDVKAVLANISLKIGQSEKSNIVNKIGELANLVTLMRDACPIAHPLPKPGQPQPQNTNNIVRLLYKKRVCNELVRAVTQLPFQKKEAVDTVNQVLKTLDEITKSINQMMAPQDPVPVAPGTNTESSATTPAVGNASNEPTASSSNDDTQRTGNAADQTFQEVSFSVQPDAVPRPVDPYEEDEDDDEDGETVDDEDDDQDDFDDDLGERAIVEDGGSEESASENEDEEETEDNGDGQDDTLNDVDDAMGNDDEADELVEDSMSSGEEDNAVVDETMGDADPDEDEDEDDDHRVAEIPADVVEEDSEMDEEDDDEEFGRFVEDIDNVGPPPGHHVRGYLRIGNGDVRAAGVISANDLLDAHVLLDGRVDDFDFIAPHLNHMRQLHQNRTAPIHEHPLMVRPSGIAETNRREAVSALPSNPTARMFLERAARGHGGVALHRQGAVRSRISIGTHNNMNFFDQIFDLANVTGRNIFDIRPRPLLNMMESLNSHELGEVHSRFVAICSGLERLTEGARMLDQHSIQFLAVLINHGITNSALEKEKMEKEQAEKEKTATNTSSVKNATNTTVATESEQSSAALQDIADPNRFEALEELNDEERAVAEQVEEEHMDTDDVGIVRTDDIDTPMEETSVLSAERPIARVENPAAELQPVNLNETNTTEASEAQQPEAMDQTSVNVELPPVPENAPVIMSDEAESTQETLANANIESTANPGSDSVSASEEGVAVEDAAFIRVPEEYRDILGDIEIPSGVDPAFLAALPDDMRIEVLRDHERQQRAQRATQQRSSASAVSAPISTGPSIPNENVAAPAAPGVEPLDQDFLNALPPELQEEILAQHERAVREAQAAANPAPPAPPVDDAVAVIESLPPGLRAQVLADADDSVLAALPANVVEEARRLRNQLDHQHAIRFQHRMMVPTRRAYVPHGGSTVNRMQVGIQAGNAATANANAVQVLDRDSVITLVMLYLIDSSKLSMARLQKVIRSLCSHAGSCDFVIWCLLSLLNKATDGENEDEVVSGPSSWFDSINVNGGGNIERALKISKDSKTVFVNSAINVNMSKNILDTLVIIAKAYPGHFLPGLLRATGKEQNNAVECSPFYQFWSLVQQHGHAKSKETPLNELKFSELEKSPIATLMDDLVKPVVQKNTPLQDRLLKVVSSVVQTLPNDTISRLGLLESASPLQHQLYSVVQLMTEGKCSQEGLTEGRTLLVEAMRALSHNTSSLIYKLLFEGIETLGENLKPQIVELLRQLAEIDSAGPSTAIDSPTPRDPSDCSKTRRVQVNRYDGERVVVDGDASGRPLANASACEELQLPAVSALTEKGGVQQSLLSSLHTVCKVRDTMAAMREQMKKEEEKKKKKEELKSDAGTEPKVAEPDQALAQVATSTSDSMQSEADQPGTSTQGEISEGSVNQEDIRLSERLASLDELWTMASDCLGRLGKASDAHAVLALQPVAEAFFLVHAVPSAANDHEHPDTKKLIMFAEKHRSVLNQVLRQNPSALADGGPFTVLTQLPKLLDFDVKRKYFRKQLTNQDENRAYRRDDVPVRVRRSQIFAESYRELFRLRPHEWKNRFYILFDGEEGQDAGGLLREWFSVITREIFNPNYALFITSPGDRVTYMINKASYINPEHLDYFKFVGRIIAKAVHDNKLLDCYFTRAFYKHILNLPVRYQDLESEDPSFYNSLQFLLENPVHDMGMELTFSLEVEEFGVREFRDLKPGGQDILVTDENKDEYVKLVCQMKMTGSIRKQLDAFLSGFYEVIPKNLIAMFNEQELELLISGLPEVDIDDLTANTDYRTYTKTSPQIQWFWRALRSFEQEDRAKFLQFVTGTSKVPLQGFASLEGMNGVQKFSIHMDSRSGDRLPAAHTCFNQLDLPQYETYEKLRESLLTAIRECTEGFGFA